MDGNKQQETIKPQRQPACRWCKNLEKLSDNTYFCIKTSRIYSHGYVKSPHVYPHSKRKGAAKNCRFEQTETDVITGKPRTRSHTRNKLELDCLICGEPVIDSTAVYCEKCREQGRAKDHAKINKFLDDPKYLYGVMGAVEEDVLKLYVRYVREFKREPSYRNRTRAANIERYIMSKDFARINILDMSGEKIIKTVHKRYDIGESLNGYTGTGGYGDGDGNTAKGREKAENGDKKDMPDMR